MKQSGPGRLVLPPKATLVMLKFNSPERCDRTSQTSPVADNTRTTPRYHDHSGYVVSENCTYTTSCRPGHTLVHCISLDLPLSEAEISALSKGLKFVPFKPSTSSMTVNRFPPPPFPFSEMDLKHSTSHLTNPLL